jgi:hypothetical protein
MGKVEESAVGGSWRGVWMDEESTEKYEDNETE